ncbi:hypothetical protein K7432_012096 [Basidiobolus ranarum]|uniref:Peroxidase n=1 Tax=Basidiobolus ranarum TaxID=34480 RepID=A0ABR2WLD5_9FUNG
MRLLAASYSVLLGHLITASQAQMPGNVYRPIFDNTLTPMIRNTPPGVLYADKVGAMPSTLYSSTPHTINCPNALSNLQLSPPPRCISTNAATYPPSSNQDIYSNREQKSSRLVTHMITFFGHFLSLDLGDLPINLTDTANLDLPAGDNAFPESLTTNGTLFFGRAQYQLGSDGYRQAFNNATFGLDGSAIYGSISSVSQTLRWANMRGKLRMTSLNNTEALPIKLNGTYLLGASPARSMNIFTMAIQVIWMREHNRICDELYVIHKDTWSEETYYQEARRRVIALIQKITYTEYLGTVLGRWVSQDREIFKNSTPSTDNFFIGTTFRYGHSELSDTYRLVDTQGVYLKDFGLREIVDLSLIERIPLELLIRSAASQIQEEVDIYFPSMSMNYTNTKGSSYDIPAFDIQRGRDLGILRYNDARAAFGLSRKASFEDISSVPDVQNRLKMMYGTVDRVESYMGGLEENKIPGSLFGELLCASLEIQFVKIRKLDE